MESNHQEFLDKYFAEQDRASQLNMMKHYMLSLSPEDLKSFFKEQLDFLEKAIRDPKVKMEIKDNIDNNLGEMIFLLENKKAVV